MTGIAEEELVLVDENDVEIGRGAKMLVHRTGTLHRAVSVFLFDRGGRLMLQRRAAGKYHSAGLWSNTCCGHPRPGESPIDAARRRLREEMGIDAELTLSFAFIYRAELGNGLVEHELDHVFVGRYDSDPAPDRHEVGGWRWTSLDDLSADATVHSERYTAWI